MSDTPKLCGFPIILGSLEGRLAEIQSALLRDQAELLDAQMMGDKEREAKAQARMDAWNRWAASLPGEG